MGEAAGEGCTEGQGRALDEEERRKLLRLQEPRRRGQGAQADPQMGCDGRGRARQSEAGRCARSLHHRHEGLGGQRVPRGPDRGGPEGEGLAEPYPPARRTQSSAVRAPEIGEHDALEGARPCRARIRPPAELDGRQDRAQHRHRASEVQDRDDEPRLQHPPAGSARTGGGCARLSALTGGVRVASCKRTARSPARRQNGPRSGTHLRTSAATARSAEAELAESWYCSRCPYVNLSMNVKLGGAPIDVWPLDPVTLFFGQVGVNARAPHPSAARLAANFMLSRECQAFLAKFGRLPTRPDVQSNPPGIIAMLTQKKVIT